MRYRWFVVCCAAVLACAPAYADDLKDRKHRVDRALDQQFDDLDESSAAVRRAAAALRAVAVALPQAERRLAVAQGQLAGALARADGARAALEVAVQAVREAEVAHGDARRRLADARRGVAQVARAAYMTGPQGYLGMLLDAESPSDLFARQHDLRVVLAQTDARVETAARARAELATRAGEIEVRKAAVAAVQRDAQAAAERLRTLADQASAARVAVAQQVAVRRTALAAAEGERAADLARYRALRAESKHLGDLIRRASGGGRTTPVVRDLLWPTAGPVTSGFGYRIHPIYHYRRFHPGIDIGAPTGQGIVAALAGTVVHAGPLGTYGNLVVVDHGNGFATAYAHQSKVLVSVGQRVAKGERIGLVGSTGAATGPHLHFETRVHGEPVDPLRYY